MGVGQFWGNQLLSDWIWGILHKRNFMPGTENLVKSLMPEEAIGPKTEPTIVVLLNGHIVKMLSTLIRKLPFAFNND